jgi:hypothetical protein
MWDVTLPHLLLHLPSCGMSAAASSLALANMLDVTLPHLLLHFPTALPQNSKNEDQNKSCQKKKVLEMMTCRIPCKYY